MLRHSTRAFVEELSFVTSVGHGSGVDSREKLGYLGAGPTVLITDLGVLRPDPETKELVINESDDLIKGALITKDGKVVHPALLRNQAA